MRRKASTPAVDAEVAETVARLRAIADRLDAAAEGDVWLRLRARQARETAADLSRDPDGMVVRLQARRHLRLGEMSDA